MPSNKKRNSKTKTKNTKKNTTNRAHRKSKLNEQDIILKNDILLIVALVAAIILLLSNFGLCGAFGRAISSFFFGIMGFIEFIFPIILFFGCAFFIANADIPRIRLKLVASILLLIVICAFLQLIMIGYEAGIPIKNYYSESSVDHLGGGIVGGLIVSLLGKYLGVVGTYIIIIALMIIFGILATQRPLVTTVRRKSSQVVNKAKQNKAKREALKAEANDDDDIFEDDEEEDDDVFIPRRNKRIKKSVGDIKLKKPDVIEEDYTGQELSISEKDDQLSFVSEEDESLTDSDPVPVKKRTPKARKTQVSKKATEEETTIVAEEIESSSVSEAEGPFYKFPPLSLLKRGNGPANGELSTQVKATALKLQETLNNFGVKATVVDVSSGPTVTRYELQPEQGVKISRITSLADDIKLNLAAEDIRIEAPIPGKAAVGIEVPNKTNSSVMLGDLLSTKEFKDFNSTLAFAVGKDLAGKTVVGDIGKMPHLLVAGATGSGKSVCINAIILSIIYKATPDEVKFIMVDPKVVELSVYNGLPHLLIPVVTDPKKASGALNWAVAEMTDRYNKFAEFGVRDIKGYNEKIERLADYATDGEEAPKKMPKIVIIIDELADLMMVAPGEVEDAIVRITQLARAAGIHLIVATQRPSVNVITGLIKANMPSRIALSVASGTDSRVIIDMNGAEKLLGKGDMLFYPQGYQKPARIQGAFVSDGEIEQIVSFIKENKGEAEYDTSIADSIASSSSTVSISNGSGDDRDTYFVEAGKFIIEKDKASIGMLQRMFKIGFNRAARIMDQLCDAGVVGEEEGTKPRKILMTMEQFENYLEEN